MWRWPWTSTTATTSTPKAGKPNWPEEFLRKNLETTEIQRQAFTKAVKAGVPIVFATDAGVFPHGLNARQFPIMVARGMTPMQAIRSATTMASRYMGWAKDVGTIEEGKFGDVIAVKGDPLEDISVLQNVEVVVKGGLLFKMSMAEYARSILEKLLRIRAASPESGGSRCPGRTPPPLRSGSAACRRSSAQSCPPSW